MHDQRLSESTPMFEVPGNSWGVASYTVQVISEGENWQGQGWQAGASSQEDVTSRRGGCDGEEDG